MGRDVTALCINEGANGVKGNSRSSINGATKVTVKVSPEKEKQGALEGKISNHEIFEKIMDSEVKNLSEMTLGSTVGSPAEKNGTALENLRKSIYSSDQEKKPEPNIQITASKQRYHLIKSHYDEEDNWSLASSATSIRTKVTVPVAPTFTCVDRLERRKEFYSKLEDKHRALEKEKHDYQARVKEEEQAAIKLLRKNMSYKANPVPSFYREGPPAKVELKKLPVTRAKSPNFTRRKSCGDAVAKATPEKPLSGRATRHSIGSTREAKGSPSPMSSKSKAQNGSPTPNGSIKVKSRTRQIKETVNVSGSEGSEGKASNADITAES